MKKLKSVILPILLCVILALSLAACGSGSAPAGNDDTSAAANESGGEEQKAPEQTSEEPEEIVMCMWNIGNTSDLDMVLDAINDYLIPKINVKIKDLVLTTNVTHLQTVNLMISGQEQLDLFSSGTMMADYPGMVAKNQLMPLDDLLAEYGQGITEVLGDKYSGIAVSDGKTYAVPCIKDMAISMALCMRKDMLEKYDLMDKKFETPEDLEKVFQTIADNEEGMYPLMAPSGMSGDALAFWIPPFDSLGDYLGVITDYTSEHPEVINLFETQDYKDAVNMAYRWNQAGYIYKDFLTTTEDFNALLSANRIFANINTTKPHTEGRGELYYNGEASANAGQDLYSIQWNEDVATTNTICNFMMSIPYYSEHAEAAMKVLNLLYTDEYLYNLFCWGIEGVHYTKNADGTVSYPEGVNASNTTWFFNSKFALGNQFLSYVLDSESTDKWEKMAEYNENSTVSVATGFIFDISNVKNEVAACLSIRDEYQPALEAGFVDPAVALPEFTQKLKDAGIEKIIAEKQKQLDEFLASK